ncbi:MAG: type II secretion system protein [Epsilonproteobacteria bacterium]|nr:type II secretion system protein [Campylobacterota bacterium]
MKFQKQRKAFSMVTAIFMMIVIMSAVGIMVMSTAGKITKETTAQFQREQSMLLAKSYTEYAIMAVMSNDRAGSGQCINTITSNDIFNLFSNGGYNAKVEIAYISNGNNDVVPLNDVNGCSRILSDAAITPGSSLNIILDVYITYKDLDNPDNQNISYHKRTLQKI